MLTTIKRITKELDVVDDIGFEAEEMDEYRKYYGRLVLKYHNTKRGMGRTYESIMDELEVIEILSTAYEEMIFRDMKISGYLFRILKR